MSNVLCVYYSRTGKTKNTMEEIAQSLDAELVELTDSVERGGVMGWLRCGLDAVQRTTVPVNPFQTEKSLKDYKLVILGTPIWAGRCSTVIRSFLKEHGGELQNAAYLVTRGSEKKYEEVYDQMDLYVPCGHRAAGSLRIGSVGYDFWKEEFLRQVREFLKEA